jgi:hypothetical protein
MLFKFELTHERQIACEMVEGNGSEPLKEMITTRTLTPGKTKIILIEQLWIRCQPFRRQPAGLPAVVQMFGYRKRTQFFQQVPVTKAMANASGLKERPPHPLPASSPLAIQLQVDAVVIEASCRA